MACDLTQGRLEPCKDSVGGIYKIYFIDFGTLGAVTKGTDDEITDLDGTFTAFAYEVKSDDTNFEQSINSSREAGTSFFEQTVNLSLKQLEKSMHKELKLLTYSRPHVVVEDRNGNAFLAGLNRGLEVTGGSIVTGGAMGDKSGYDLTFTGQEALPANFIEGATKDNPFAGLATGIPTITEGT